MNELPRPSPHERSPLRLPPLRYSAAVGGFGNPTRLSRLSDPGLEPRLSLQGPAVQHAGHRQVLLLFGPPDRGLLPSHGTRVPESLPSSQPWLYRLPPLRRPAPRPKRLPELPPNGGVLLRHPLR